MTAALQDRDEKRKVNEEADMEKSKKKMNCPQLTYLKCQIPKIWKNRNKGSQRQA